MPLPVFDKPEDIPEAVKSGYVEKDGKWVPDVEDVSGLKSTLGKLKRQIEEYKEIDPVKYKDLLAKADVAEQERLKSAGQWDALQKKVEGEKKALEDQLKAEIAKRDQRIRSFLVDDRVKAAALKAGVIPEDIDDVLTLTRNRFDLDENEQIFVKDDKGERDIISLDKFFAEKFKKDKPKFFVAPPGAGGFTGQPAGGGNGRGGISISRADAADPAKYRAAKKIADERGVELELEPLV